MYISLFFKETDLLADNGLSLNTLYSHEFDIPKYCQYSLDEVVTTTESGIRTLELLEKKSYNYIEFLKILKNFKSNSWDIRKARVNKGNIGFFISNNIEVYFTAENYDNVHKNVLSHINKILKKERFLYKNTKDFFDYV